MCSQQYKYIVDVSPGSTHNREREKDVCAIYVCQTWRMKKKMNTLVICVVHHPFFSRMDWLKFQLKRGTRHDLIIHKAYNTTHNQPPFFF